MSYVKRIEYKVVPTDTFKIVRGCSGCGCKQTFASRDTFRVNANGNKLDVWLIYGCERCNHTYNLPIYERIHPAKVPETEYASFLSNDREAVFAHGTQKSIFVKNRADIAWDAVKYDLVEEEPWNRDKVAEEETQDERAKEAENINIRIHNPYHIPLREDKIVAEVLQISRSKAKRLLRTEEVIMEIV